jgi:hypothetical protein
MRLHRCGLAAAIFILSGTSGFAQTANAPRDPNMPDPKSTIPEKIQPQDPNATGVRSETGDNLSKKLEQSEGVIKPPANVDPGITAAPPVPNPGTTPVIRPPGSSPSDPVQPK